MFDLRTVLKIDFITVQNSPNLRMTFRTWGHQTSLRRLVPQISFQTNQEFEFRTSVISQRMTPENTISHDMKYVNIFHSRKQIS